jgi:VIT1/CCC1 family predicted Fe2+/Mn2+ transporter
VRLEIAAEKRAVEPRTLAKSMSGEASKTVKRFLDPIDRISEILFGLVMVLTITCSFSVGGGGRTEVHQMLIGALGCNVAWGVIDAMLYWLACFHAHGQKIIALRAVRDAENPDEAYRAIADALPPVIASAMSPAELETVRQKLRQLPAPPEHPHLTKDEWLAGLGVFLLVVLATLPVVLPFLFVHDPTRALRISNSIAVLLLFLTGYLYGYHTGYRPLTSGLIGIVVGSAMVGATIALGG